jgi:hypothetical protein
MLNSLNPSSIQQIDRILNEITLMAITIKTLSYQAADHCDQNREVAAFNDAMGRIASNIGYMADEGLGQIGSSRMQDAEDWFLPDCKEAGEGEKNE